MRVTKPQTQGKSGGVFMSECVCVCVARLKLPLPRCTVTAAAAALMVVAAVLSRKTQAFPCLTWVL